MKLWLGPLTVVCAGLATLSAGCSAAPAAEARRANSSAQIASEAEPSAPAAPSSAAPEQPSDFHLVEFMALGRGDRIADLGSGRGYSIASLSDAVGPFGVVYVRHAPGTLHERPSEQASEPDVPSNVIQMDTPIEAPFASEAKNLDCAALLFGYHELVAERRDRRGFNRAVFRALKPGALYIIVEHAPVAGGADAAQDEDRIEPGAIRSEVEAVGFRFVEAADFHAREPEAANVPRPPHPSQYVLKFQKPR